MLITLFLTFPFRLGKFRNSLSEQKIFITIQIERHVYVRTI